MTYFRNQEDYLENILRSGIGKGDKDVVLLFHTKTHRNVRILVDFSDGNQKVVTFPAFSLQLNNRIKLHMPFDDFNKDIRKIVGLLTYVCAVRREFEFILDQLLHEHVLEHGRIIDTDLCTYIAEICIVLDAFSRSESGNGLTTNGRNALLNRFMVLAETKYGDKLLINKVQNVNGRLTPNLVSMNDFVQSTREQEQESFDMDEDEITPV